MHLYKNMNKKVISVLIVLMSISLLGIILVQVLWIRNAVEIEERTFQTNINTMLRKVVNNLEEEESVFLIGEELHSIPDNKLENNEIREIRQFIDDNQDSHHSHINIRTSKKLKNKKPQIIQSDTQVIVMEASNSASVNVWHPKLQSDSNFNINVEVTTKDTLIRRFNKEKQIENIFEKVIYKFKSKDISVENRINLKKLPNLIQSELDNFNIVSDFRFAIIDGKTNNIIHSSDSLFNQELKESNYQVSLFPNDIFKTNRLLSINLPNSFNLVYKSILPLLLLSGIFTLFIIITFINAVFFILKQKRISDIKSDFINNITHEFKTPIATIGLASDSINNPKVIGNPDRIRYFTGIIKDENFRMNKQVENILQLSLFGKHEIELNPQACHLNEIIQKATEHIQLQIDEKNGKITTNLSALNDIVKVDEVHFINALFNLFDNAIKYSDNNPLIEIETSNNEKEIVVTISDHGIGMNPDIVKKIFKKFYRAETGNIHSVKGFGLGLNYVKLVIEKHQGSINVVSKKGNGTSIIINLPLNNL